MIKTKSGYNAKCNCGFCFVSVIKMYFKDGIIFEYISECCVGKTSGKPLKKKVFRINFCCKKLLLNRYTGLLHGHVVIGTIKWIAFGKHVEKQKEILLTNILNSADHQKLQPRCLESCCRKATWSGEWYQKKNTIAQTFEKSISLSNETPVQTLQWRIIQCEHDLWWAMKIESGRSLVDFLNVLAPVLLVTGNAINHNRRRKAYHNV